MADNKEVEIKIVGDTSDFEKATKQASKSVDKMAKDIVKAGDKAEDSFDGLEKSIKDMGKQMKNMFKNMNMNGFTSSINKAMKQAKQTVSNTAKSMTKVLDNVFGKKRTMELSAKTTTDASGGVSNATALAGSILTSGAMGSQTAKQMALIKDSVDNMVKTTSSAFKGLSTETQDKISKAVTISISKLEELKEFGAGIEGFAFDPKGALLGEIENLKEELKNLEKIHQLKKDVLSAKLGEELTKDYEQVSTKIKETQQAYETFITLSDLGQQVEEINRLAQSWEDFRDSADAEALIGHLKTLRDSFTQVGISVEEIDDAIKHYEMSIEKTGKVQNSTTKEMQKAVQYINQVDGAFKDYTRTLDEQKNKQNIFTTSILKIRKAMPGLASIYDKTTASVKKMAEEHKKAGKEITNTAKKSENVLKSLGKSLAPYIGLAAVFGGLKKSITSYTDSLQDSSKFGLMFGSQAQDMTDWLNQLNSTVTVSKGTLMDFSGNMFRMGKNMDMSTEQAIKMSKEMTELGADLVALTGDVNIMDALAGAMRGEMDSLENFGFIISDAALETEALKHGFDLSTDSGKALATQAVIVGQSMHALGYGAEQAKTLGGQMVMLRKNIEALGASIGSCFAGILQVVLPVLNNIVVAVTSAFNQIAKVINAIFGVFGIKVGGASASGGTGGGAIGDAVGNIGGALADGLDEASGGASDVAKDLASGAESAKEIAKGLLGIDELNVLSSPDKGSSGGSGSGGSGGAGGSGGTGGVGALGDIAGAAEEGSNVFKETFEELEGWMKDLVNGIVAMLNTLKAGWQSVGDYISTSIDNLKQAFSNLGGSLKEFLISAWNNGGEQLVYNFGRLGGAVVGAIIDISGQCVQMVADLFTHLDPDSNPYTKKFIDGLNNLLVACQNFALSAGGWFKTFVDNGGQAFLNVMGDILMILGTTLANILANVINWVTLFMNSWAGQLLIEGVALALNLVAGAIKAVMVVIEKLTPLWSALLLAFGLKSGINTAITLFGKLGKKLVDFGLEIASNIESVVVWGKNIVLTAKDAIKNFGSKLKDGYKHLKDFAKNLKDNIKKVKEWNKSHTKNWDDVKKGWKNFVTNIKDRIKAIGTHLKDGITKLKNWCKDWKTHLNTLKTNIANKLNGIKTAFTNNWSAIKTWGANTIKMVKDTVKKAISSFTAWITSLTWADVQTGLLTAGTWLLNGALAVLTSPITWIIAAIVALIAIIKKVGDHFNWWTKIMDWLKEKCGWLYDGIMKVWEGAKSFFGWEAEDNGIEDEANNAGEALDGLGDTMEETSDRFGTACSAINEALNSIGIDGNRIALQLDEAEASFNEKFSMMSKKSQEYLQAIADGNEEVMNQMAGDADTCMADIIYTFNNMSVQEQALWYATYGEIEGVTDGWLDYTTGSYDECLAKHSGMMLAIKNNELIGSEEKTRLMNEEVESFKKAMDSRESYLEGKINEINAMEWQSEEDRYNAVKQYSDELDLLRAQMTENEIGYINDAEDAVLKSTELQGEAYDGVADSQTKALEGVDTALETTKGNLATFKEESDKVAQEIPKAWEGVGEEIGSEFEDALGSIESSMTGILSNTKKQCEKLKGGLEKTFDNIKSGVKKSMVEVNKTITSKFTEAVDKVKTITDRLKDGLQKTFQTIASGISTSLNNIKQSMTTSFSQVVNSINTAMQQCKSQISTTLTQVNTDVNTKTGKIVTIVGTNLKDVKSKFTKPFTDSKNSISQALSEMNTTISSRLGTIVNTLKTYATRMKNTMNFKFPTPYLKMPHISVYGNWDFEKKTVPSFRVNWWSSGAIFNKRTILGNMGVGDAQNGYGNNPEAVLPLDSLWSEMAKNFDKQTQALSKMNNNGTTTVIVELDGKEVARSTVKNMKQMSQLGQLDTSWL